MLLQILLALALNTEARINSPLLRRSSYPNGVATFNDYSSQSNTNCGPMAGQPGTYGAAASDISPDISGGKCDGSINLSNCNGQSPMNGGGPSCPKTNCGKCYKVTNQGAVSGGEPVGGTGNSVIVQIIDSCPSANPQNYCKTDSPPDQTCEDPNTNQLDIDNSAYEALTGQAYGSGPNLQILIEDSDCSGGLKMNEVPAASSSTPPPTSSLPPSPVAASTPQPATSLPAPSPPPVQPAASPLIITGPYTNGSSSSLSSALQDNPVQEVNQPPAQALQINEDDVVTKEEDDDDECWDEDEDTS